MQEILDLPLNRQEADNLPCYLATKDKSAGHYAHVEIT